MGFNCFPAYQGTGTRIAYIARDWREVRIKLTLNWRTKPGRSTLFATFRISEQETELIRAASLRHPSLERIYRVDLVDAEQRIHASVEKTVYIRSKAVGEKKG